MKGAFTFCFAILFTFSYGQLFRKEINRYDSSGKRTGLWINYWDTTGKILMSKARFKEGYEKGVSKEYYQNGIVRLKFRYYKNRIRTKYYFESGKLDQKGWSKIEWAGAATHYYWQGRWKFFDEHRKLIRKAWFLNGRELTLEK